jgi:DNA-binding HxlR family transcriptional regulator
MPNVPKKRSYHDPCGIARALDLVGDRWALLIVRELLLGPKRFTDLRAGLQDVAPDVLSQRLRELESSGVVARRTLAPPAASRVYELTAWGEELEPALHALGRWGSRAAFARDHHELGVDSFVIALRTMFDPALAGGFSASYELRLGDQPFGVAVAEGRLSLTRGVCEHPDATLDTDVAALSAVLWHGRSLREAIADGSIRVAGSRAAVNRLTRLFAVPVAAAAA